MRRMSRMVCAAAVLTAALVPASSVDIGGNLESSVGLMYDGSVTSSFSTAGELEFFLPATNDITPRLVLTAATAANDEGDYQPSADFGVKYAYLRYHTDYGHLTLGRQPVSWSYGAMFNPFDFGFGIDDLAGETVTPSMDGVRSFIRIGDRASLNAVGGYSELTQQPLDELDFGARLRIPMAGRDVSFNVIFQPDGNGDTLLRSGATYSGDLGPVGIYGAAGYYRLLQEQRDDSAVQLGIDWSWEIGPEHEEKVVYLQAEYLRFLFDELGDQAFGHFAAMSGSAEAPFDMQDILLAVLSVELDYFTRTGAAVFAETSDWMVGLAPFYETELSGGADLRIDGSVIFDQQGEVSGGISAGLSFYF